jgi:hypothetical protein
VKVGVATPPELLVIAATVRPQLNSMLAGRPVIIPPVSRVNAVHVEAMTGLLPLGAAGKVCWNRVTAETLAIVTATSIAAIAYRLLNLKVSLRFLALSKPSNDRLKKNRITISTRALAMINISRASNSFSLLV